MMFERWPSPCDCDSRVYYGFQTLFKLVYTDGGSSHNTRLFKSLSHYAAARADKSQFILLILISFDIFKRLFYPRSNITFGFNLIYESANQIRLPYPSKLIVATG